MHPYAKVMPHNHSPVVNQTSLLHSLQNVPIYVLPIGRQ